MEECKVALDTNVNHFSEIFFENGQGNITTNAVTKLPFRLVLLFVLLTAGFCFLGLYAPKMSWLIVLSTLCLFCALIYFSVAAAKYHLWKSAVTKYLKTVKQIKAAELTLKEQGFQLKVDQRVIFEKYTSLKKVDITGKRILLESDTENYFFPAKAMSNEAYDRFKCFLEEQVMK